MRTVARFVAAVLGAVSLRASIAVAAPSLLDPAFGAGGKVTTNFAPAEAVAWAIALQADGKIVVAGGTAPGHSYNFTLTRYDTSGTLDPSFGNGGIVTTAFVSGSEVHAVLVQPDGKIVAVGIEGTYGLAFALARYDAAGVLDPAFGDGGTVTAQLTGTNDNRALAAALQPDGKIVAAGISCGVYGPCDGLLARFATDGTLDRSFGNGDGFVITRTLAFGVALQPDGKIVVAGGYGSGSGAASVERYDTDGNVDAGFGAGGRVTTAVSAGSLAWDVVRQPDGKLVVAGAACTATLHECDPFVARYLEDGSPDPSFGDGGIVTTVIGVHEGLGSSARALAIVPDGAIVTAGNAASNGPFTQAFGLARYLPDGSLDASFGGGTVTTPIGQEANAVVVAPDGAIIAAGEGCFLGPDHTSDCGFALARYRVCGCAACERCDATGGCVAAPQSGCRVPIAPEHGRLVLHDSGGGAGNRLVWRWLDGERTAAVALGSPAITNDYALCMYDEAGSVLLRATAPAGGTCEGRPCWTSRARTYSGLRRFTYRDHSGTPEGLTGMEIRPGLDGRARAVVKGRGERVAVPPLPLTPPVRVQLQAENGECWEAIFGDAGVRRNDATDFEGQATGP